MKRRIIPMLADPKAVPDFYGEISLGLNAIFENATSILNHAKLLSENKAYRGEEILAIIADEEAAKFLILLDAVRCPKDRLTLQLSYAYSHLAKGIYAEACLWSCNTFGELRSGIESKRLKLFLDGDGEGRFWICENEIEQRREDKIYVDYIYWDDTGYQWSSPKTMEDLGTMRGESPVFRIIRAIQSVGITSPEALKVVNSIWSEIIIDDDFGFRALRAKNMEILQELSKLGLLKVNIADEACQTVNRDWSYPLYPLDLRKVDVKRADLEEVAGEREQEWWESII
jgi:AbiV family abortive infection protein